MRVYIKKMILMVMFLCCFAGFIFAEISKDDLILKYTFFPNDSEIYKTEFYMPGENIDAKLFIAKYYRTGRVELQELE